MNTLTNSLKLAAITATAITFATSAPAGGLGEPIEMPSNEIIADTAGGASTNLVLPLILIALIAAAVASSGGDGPGPCVLAVDAPCP